MASPATVVTVSLSDYLEGNLPDVCTVSGRNTTDRYRHVTEVVPSEWVQRVMERLERIFSPPPRRGRILVVRGRIPLDAAVATSLRRRRRLGAVGTWIGLVALVAIAWSAAPWAPAAAAVAIGFVAVSAWTMTEMRRRLPNVAVDTGGDRVTLTGVHQNFAAAVTLTAEE